MIIKDLASKDIRDLPDSTPAVWLDELSLYQEFTAYKSFRLVDHDGDLAKWARPLSCFEPGEKCLIAEDEHRDDEPATWWLSEVLPS